MGIAKRKKRICPLKNGQAISSAECGRIRAKGDCPASCPHNQKSRSEIEAEIRKRLDPYSEAMDVIESDMARFQDSLGFVGYTLGELLLKDPFIEDADTIRALEMAVESLKTGVALPDSMNRAGNLASEIKQLADELRQAPYALRRNESRYVLEYFLVQSVSFDFNPGKTETFSSELRKRTMDIQREYQQLRREETGEPEASEEQDEDRRIILPGDGDSRAKPSQGDDKPKIILPGS